MNNILSIKDLHVHYETGDGLVYALNGINLNLYEGTTMGLVGETGAGKTTLAKAVMALLSPLTARIKSGEILYFDKNLLTLNKEAMRVTRGREISMIFQDPMTSLNPVIPVGEQIAEAIAAHGSMSSKEAMDKAKEILELVDIPGERAGEYPHQFSGGMRQRVVIAIALACSPKLLIADEPTTALDVTIQAQVLELMRDLKDKLNTSMLLITHDLGVVAQTCDYVSIVYAGTIVESGTVREVFHNTLHPYTKGLFSSIPNLKDNVKRLTSIEGLMPDPTILTAGCKFAERCQYAKEICMTTQPKIAAVRGEHKVSCLMYENKGEWVI